jgi:uncharacterized UPF0160 family protein
MNTKNNTKMFIESMGEKFEVKLLTKGIIHANEFLEANPETSVIDETDNGIIIIANTKPEPEFQLVSKLINSFED